MIHKEMNKNKKLHYKNDLEYLEDYFRLIDLELECKQLEEIDENFPLGNDFSMDMDIDDIDFDNDERSNQEKIIEIKRQIKRKIREIQKRKKYSQEKKKTFYLDKLIKKYNFNKVEKKIIIFLLYQYFTSNNHSSTGRFILENITSNRLEMMRYRHYLMEHAKLQSNKLIQCEELDGRSILDMEFSLPEELISKLLGEKHDVFTEEGLEKEKQEKSNKDYLHLYFSLVQLMEKKSELLSIIRNEDSVVGFLDNLNIKENSKELGRIKYEIKKLKLAIEDFGDKKNVYAIEQVAKENKLSYDEKLIMVILLRDSLGLSDTFVGCEGKKLLAMISDSEEEMIIKRSLLYKEGKLRKNSLIEMEKRWSGQNILDGEYFISERMIRRLLDHIDGNENISIQNYDFDEEGKNYRKLQPRFSFDDVILSSEKKRSIEIALSQQINYKLIFETWGFGKKIPYGSALTMLFSGVPGTGKTMMAEAIAHALGKDLLIANYSQIQNMYVGETEKRIVNTFKQAKEEKGVLLWDEADAMFYSRDMARNSWEFRDINVILQELEKFSGVVILTTNRKVDLDRALDRRISLKVTFDMPMSEERKLIWQSILPKEAPLDSKIDFGYLADKYEISGGVIKNAILHAARYAAYKEKKKITMEDLIKGVELEQENSWNKISQKIGFK